MKTTRPKMVRKCFCVTREEKQAFKAAARKAGKSLSAWCRDALASAFAKWKAEQTA